MPPSETARIVVEPGKLDRDYYKDVWRHRELFFVLAWRGVSVRYRQTAIGIGWALFRPALSTIIFTIVFGRLGQFPSGDAPYALLVMAGMLPWQLFGSALAESGQSVLANSDLVTKVYFPRIILPGSALVTSLIDFAISTVLLVVLMIVYRITPGWQILALPVFVIFTLAIAAVLGVWIAALNVSYRDVGFIVPFIVQFGVFLSPVGFSTAVVPERWRLLYALNPMVGAIEGFRWCLLGGAMPVGGWGLFVSLPLLAVLAFTGVRYFRRAERRFADVI